VLQTDSFVVGKNGFVSPNIMMERYKNALLIKNRTSTTNGAVG